jgi:hypothetical protein
MVTMDLLDSCPLVNTFTRLLQLLVWKVSFGEVISRHGVHHGSSEVVFSSPKRTIVEIRCIREGQYTWSSGPDANNTCLPVECAEVSIDVQAIEDARLLAQGLNCPWSNNCWSE